MSLVIPTERAELKYATAKPDIKNASRGWSLQIPAGVFYNLEIEQNNYFEKFIK